MLVAILGAIVLLISTSLGHVPGVSAQEAMPSPAVPKDGVVRDPD